MKKYLLILLAVICVLSLAACKKSSSMEQTDTDDAKLDNSNWGVTLTVENVTPTSVTIKCTQSGGEPTGELQTGSYYILENFVDGEWKQVDYILDGEIGWTAEAWMIPKEDTVEWDINWEWLYGELPEGDYRIGKEVMDFRGTGDYDKAMYYVEFEI